MLQLNEAQKKREILQSAQGKVAHLANQEPGFTATPEQSKASRKTVTMQMRQLSDSGYQEQRQPSLNSSSVLRSFLIGLRLIQNYLLTNAPWYLLRGALLPSHRQGNWL